MTTKTILLCILDGWGETTGSVCDAIMQASTPSWNDISLNCLRSSLHTSGLAVGLPEGQMGNSEVGHMNIGGGRVVLQSLPKIDAAIVDGSLVKNDEIQKQIKILKENKKAVHIMGLVSDGGVHAHQAHMVALAKIYNAEGIRTHLHLFTDGRDTAPDSAIRFVSDFINEISGLENVSIATISGRYYSMDRDKRWDRVELAYDAITLGNASAQSKFANSLDAIKESYKNNKQDEFILPVASADYAGMQDGDALMFANFRADRARQISLALAKPDFDGFTRKRVVKFSSLVGMVDYSDEISKYLSAVFPSENLTNTLGEIIANNNLKQLRIAETEKYAHVTFFFNGGVEAVFEGEDRVLVPSPNVATYDLQPEMSCPEVTDKLVAAIESGKYSLIVCNYANADMVGHTGIMPAAIKAVQAVDTALGRLQAAIKKTDGVMLITADHGNIEQMCTPDTHEPHTAHTTGPVPFIVYNYKGSNSLKNGRLADIAPTILKIMGLPKPEEMNGTNLLG